MYLGRGCGLLHVLHTTADVQRKLCSSGLDSTVQVLVHRIGRLPREQHMKADPLYGNFEMMKAIMI